MRVPKANSLNQTFKKLNPGSTVGIFYCLLRRKKVEGDEVVLPGMKEYFKIGKMVATFGLKGELLLKHNLGKKTSFKGLKAIFIEERKESFVPWFIESTRIKNEGETYLKLEGINMREQAIKLTQKEVWLPEEDFKKFSAKSSPINFLGYDIIEEDKVLGKILEVIEQPHQILCRIELNNKEAFVPLHDETILKIDKKKNQITVSLPPGLLEIYQ